MLGKLFSFAASKAAGEAVDGIARRAIWGGLAAVLFIFSFAMAMLIAYWLLEPKLGFLQSALILALACAVAGLAAVLIPGLLDRSKKAATYAQQETSLTAQPVESVKADVDAAVDYFGALQVVASAFMFGIGAARQVRRKS